MAKKTVKEKTKELFKEFTDKHGYGVYNDGFNHAHYVIRKPKGSESTHDFYHNDFLDSNLDSIGSHNAFFNFMTDILNKGENEVALYQAIKKTPAPKSYSFDSHVNSVLSVLTPYTKTLFEYVARPKFLESSWERIDSVFNTLDSQDYRVAIIEAMLQTKTFNALDTQKGIYNIVQKHITDPSKFDSYFDRINKVSESQSVIDYIDTPAIVVIGFTSENLIGANLNTEINSNYLVDSIKRISNSLKEKHQEDLHIMNTLMDYNKDTKQHSLYIVCPQSSVGLNKFVFERMINDVSRLSKSAEVNAYNQDDSRNRLIKECKILYLHATLEDTLSLPQEGVKRTKSKI
jgi:hypothetical protein